MTPPLTSRREMVRASAGSGKTYRISSQIIALLAAGVEPSSIFASTFTRKAAGEILERVLFRLAAAASSPEAAHELGEAVAATPAPDADPHSPEFWTRVLGRTMRQIHRLDIGTLDSFFGRAARAFSHELGLPADWSLGSRAELERLDAQAIQTVLRTGDRALTLELLRELAAGPAARSVHSALQARIDAWQAIARDLDPGAGPGWRAFEQAFSVPAPEPVDVRQLERDLASLELPQTKAGTPNKTWQGARMRLVGLLQAGDWAALLDHRLVQASGEAEATFGRTEISADWHSVLERLRAAARSVLVPELVRRARAMDRLGNRFVQVREELQRRQGMLDFSDVTWLVGGAQGAMGHADRAWRMDAGIQHLLLDEFQDTSRDQWRALAPFADAVVRRDAPQPPGSALIVADPKQSIYGWRGAEPVLLDPVAERYELADERLETSYRSSPTILDAVNRSFVDLPGTTFMQHTGLDEVHRQAMQSWASNFSAHRAHHTARPGHVRLEVGPPDAGQSTIQTLQLRHAAQRIQTLRDEFPGRSIGVLVRTNGQVGHLIHELRRLGVAVSEEGGTRLVDSPVVVSVLALLRIADHPGDRLARYHVAHTAVALALPALGLDAPFEVESEPLARECSLRLRERLLQDGYGRVLSLIGQALAPHVADRDRLRLEQLTQIGFEHDGRPGLRVDAFIERVHHERREAEGSAAVRVMTIWGSKGLQFDVVVLPALSFSFGGRANGANDPLVYRPSPLAPATHVFPPMPKSVRKAFEADSTELREAAAAAAQRGIRDGLSALYVAMTRARHALHMIIPADGSSVSRRASAANLVRAQLMGPDAFERITEGDVLYERRDDGWVSHGEVDVAPPSPSSGALGQARSIVWRADGPRSRALQRRRPSDHGPAAPLDAVRYGLHQGTTEAGADLALPPRVRGTLVHAWLEAIEWLDAASGAGLPDLARARALARDVALSEAHPISTEQVEREWARLREQLSAPEVAALLDQDASSEQADGGDRISVERELPFLRRERSTLTEGIIDRLVLHWRDGGVIAAHVVDYKTDRVGPEVGAGVLEQRIAQYRPQLRTYRAAVADLYRLPPAAVRCSLAFLEIGQVVEIGPDADRGRDSA